MDSAPPLAGITVVAIEHAIAAPLCTRQLAELGARVIKIERRETGDFARHYDNRVNGQSSHFIWTNRSKESLTLDLKHPDTRLILDRLLPTADVLVQNLAPLAAARMGLSYDALHSPYPELIVCNISGYGGKGPYADKKAYDLLVQAEAGLLSVTGLPDAVVKSGISIADIAAAMQAHTAILAAIIQRGKTGAGSNIEVSMLEAMVEWMGFPLYYAYDGADPPSRQGADHASIYPYGAFATSDGQVLMLGLQNEREWKVFCEQVLNNPSLVDDARFSSNTLRSENRDSLRLIIQDTLRQFNADDLSGLLDTLAIANARVNNMTDVWTHPQLQALNRYIRTETPNGPVQSLHPPGHNNSYKPSLGAVPAIGEHTEHILTELGFTTAELKAFKVNKAI